jgi:hypothetical protein
VRAPARPGKRWSTAAKAAAASRRREGTAPHTAGRQVVLAIGGRSHCRDCGVTAASGEGGPRDGDVGHHRGDGGAFIGAARQRAEPGGGRLGIQRSTEPRGPDAARKVDRRGLRRVIGAAHGQGRGLMPVPQFERDPRAYGCAQPLGVRPRSILEIPRIEPPRDHARGIAVALLQGAVDAEVEREQFGLRLRVGPRRIGGTLTRRRHLLPQSETLEHARRGELRLGRRFGRRHDGAGLGQHVASE